MWGVCTITYPWKWNHLSHVRCAVQCTCKAGYNRNCKTLYPYPILYIIIIVYNNTNKIHSQVGRDMLKEEVSMGPFCFFHSLEILKEKSY